MRGRPRELREMDSGEMVELERETGGRRKGSLFLHSPFPCCPQWNSYLMNIHIPSSTKGAEVAHSTAFVSMFILHSGFVSLMATDISRQGEILRSSQKNASVGQSAL